MDRRRFLQTASVLAVAAAAGGCASRSTGSDPVVSRDLAFAFDAQGNRYEMDIRGYRVRRVDAAGNIIWSVGDPANPALLNGPTSLGVDAQGTVYVADKGNGEIEKISASGVALATFGRDLASAHDLVLDPGSGLIYVSDGSRHHIRVFGIDGRSVGKFGSFGRTGAGLNFPRGLAISPTGELHIVDSGNARIQVFGLDGAFRRSYGGPADTLGQLGAPRDVVFTLAGEAIVADPYRRRLAWFDAGGAFTGHGQVYAANGEPGHPAWLAVGPDGRLYVTII